MRSKTRRHCTFRPQVEPLEDRRLLALVITPTFDTSINSDPNAATIKATINTAIAAYKSTFADNVTVKITFKKDLNIDLGANSTIGLTVAYSAYRAALASHSKTPDDTTALASLGNSPTNPVNGGTSLVVASALARALGLSRTPPPLDSTISLNTAICNLDRKSTDATKYDLLSVTCHEIDEALGLGSALDGLTNGAAAPSTIDALDLFRFDQTGARSFNTTLATQAFFSINGGTTKLAQFNQDQAGDFGDWYSPGGQTPQIQDAFGTKGATPILGVELTRLDVLGYNRSKTAAPVVTAPSVQLDTATSFNLGSFTGGNGLWTVDVDWADGSAHDVFNISATGSLGSRAHTYGAGAFLPKVTVTDFTGVAGSATFDVTDVTTSITIDANNNLVIKDVTTAGKDDNITIQADTANSRYVITDPSASSAFGLVGTVSGATISDPHTAFVPFSAFSGSISVLTLAGNDSLTIDLSLGAFPNSVSFDGGVGSNTLIGPGSDTTWNLNSANAGTITGVATFTNTQNLTGGVGRDVFAFGTGGTVAGKIKGGAGSNWLDYSAISSVVVNLASGFASRIAGGVSGFNNAIGSILGGDKITGNTAGGVLVGHGTGNTITAGAGRTVIIGGYGLNVLTGGGADDLIINGRTLFDGNSSALDAIRVIWQGAETIGQRMTALTNAGPNQFKIGATVALAPSRTVNGAGPRFGLGGFVYGSTLIGNGGSNWFFTLNVASVVNRKPTDVITMF